MFVMMNGSKKISLSEDEDGHLPSSSKQGLQIDFEDVCFHVQLASGRKDILKSISGSCKPGRLLSIMGSSGAGKTTVSSSSCRFDELTTY